MYDNFAKYYDALMTDVDYSARTDYVCLLFSKYGKQPSLLLDLACGSGGFSNEFAKRGISVIGVDMSEEMLSVAQDKSRAQGLDVLYICQEAQNLDLYGTVDGAVCLLDSLNHITDYDKLCEVFIKVSLFLEKNSLFIFDMNTVYKHEHILADNTFVIETKDLYCAWQNFYDKNTKITDITLDFFEYDGKSYNRSTDSFFERAYTEKEIRDALNNAGFSIEAILGDISQNPPGEKENRVFFVAKKL